MEYDFTEIESYVEKLFKGHRYAEFDYFNGHILRVVNWIIEHKQMIIDDIGEKYYPMVLVVAYLHDVIEDTKVTFEELEFKYGNGVASSVRLLTRKKSDSYAQYLINIIVNYNKIAMYVKLADLQVNIAQSNVEIKRTQGDKNRIASQRIDKYLLARYIIEKELTKGHFE